MSRTAPNFPFDAILFDVGGVVLTNGWDHEERALVLGQFQIDRPAFEERHTAAYPDWERGATTVDEYLAATVFYEPRPFTPEEFLTVIKAQSKLLPDGAIGIIQQLVASDKCLIGALNNEARETNDFRFARFGLRDLFEVAFSSCYLGLRKPDLAIYRAALDILGRPAERVLFIDDRQENCAGAAAAGIKAIRFQGAPALQRELENLGVL
jgi:putative hydrolase of the HAD superfamily